jgi:hypothetical protein
VAAELGRSAGHQGRDAEVRFRPTHPAYEQRVEASKLARTQSELMRLFADLPAPHPLLPTNAVPAAEADDETPPPIYIEHLRTAAFGAGTPDRGR